VQGPYRVVENAGTTLRLCIGDETVRVSSDRVTRAPTRYTPSLPTSTPETPSDPVITPPARGKDAVPRKSKTPPEGLGLPFLRESPIRVRETRNTWSTDLWMHKMKYMGQILYQVRWLGYDPAEDTWEEKTNYQVTLFVATGALRGCRPSKGNILLI
jgi:hypothetical protein